MVLLYQLAKTEIFKQAIDITIRSTGDKLLTLQLLYKLYMENCTLKIKIDN